MAKNDDVPILVSQVWADRQSGQEGRTVQITEAEITDKHGHPISNARVKITTLTPTNNAFNPEQAIGRKGSVSVDNLRRNYEMIRDAPDDPADDELSVEALWTRLQDEMSGRGTGSVSMNFTGHEWTCGIVVSFPGAVPQGTDPNPTAYFGTGKDLIEAVRAAMSDAGWDK